jgi:integrase
MSRPINRLSARQCQTIKEKGKHADGGGLYLCISGSDARSWMFLYHRDGRRREMGLGSLRSVSLARARELAAQARADVAEDIDPKARRGRRHVVTFGECADRLFEDLEPGWSNARHIQQWRRSLTIEAAALRSVPVDAVTTEGVLEVLKPQWLTHAPSAARLRLRIERVLDWAKAKGYRSGENPARWRGHLAHLLPRQKHQIQHLAAMDYRAVPAFYRTLAEIDTFGSRVMRIVILTAVRAGEALRARWSEIDLGAAVWEIPAARMKGRKEHRIPLSPPALEILRELHTMRVNDFVFPSVVPGRPMTNASLSNLLRKRGLHGVTTTHGFRSSFRDWAGDRSVLREVAEAALAHETGSAVERAYRRGDAFEQRRKLMDDWAAYVTNESAGATVITLRR